MPTGQCMEAGTFVCAQRPVLLEAGTLAQRPVLLQAGTFPASPDFVGWDLFGWRPIRAGLVLAAASVERAPKGLEERTSWMNQFRRAFSYPEPRGSSSSEHNHAFGQVLPRQWPHPRMAPSGSFLPPSNNAVLCRSRGNPSVRDRWRAVGSCGNRRPCQRTGPRCKGPDATPARSPSPNHTPRQDP